MKFNPEKKNAIILYLLEKISENAEHLSKRVAETFQISTNTVHSYLNELQQERIIEKTKHGQYKLVRKTFSYDLKRSNGDLNSDTYAYVKCLEPHVKTLADNVRRIWSYAFSEMINNVMDHSGAENLKIEITQDHLKTCVTIVDDGVGIFEKIKAHFGLSDLDEAICELCKGKLTTDAANHSGEGIFFTSRMMDTFFIASGGKIFSTTKYNNDSVSDLDKSRSGTCVFMALSNFTHKDSRDVFDFYANEDGGFTKTRIPLKNIFDTAPVSRSQAKRICNRLDLFEEVILDFEDLDWMGQGFAHQLFVVYQNAHPNVRLIPENMNESVAKMYSHVINSVG